MLGKKLKELRRLKGITQADLAEEIDTTSETICKWENGKVEPYNKNLKKLAEAFDVSIKELLED